MRSDGAGLAAGFDDGVLLVWQPLSWTEGTENTPVVLRQHEPNRVRSLAFGGDPPVLVSTGLLPQQEPESPATEHADDQASSDQAPRMSGILIWDVSGADWTSSPPQQARSDDVVSSLAFGRKDRRLVAGTRSGEILVWKLEDRDNDTAAPRATQTTPIRRAHRGWVSGIASAPDRGFFVSVGDDGMVRLWDAVDEPCDMFPWKQAEITSLAFVAPKSRNEGRLAVGVSEREAGKGSIYVFPTRGSWFASDSCPPLGDGIELPKENRAGSWPTSVAISPDGEAIAAGAPDSVLRLWTKSVNGWERQTATSPGSGGVWSVAWLPGAERPTCLVSGWGQPQPSRSGAQDALSGEIRLYPADKALAAPVRSLFIRDVREKLHEMPVLSLAVSRDGTMLAAGTRRPGRAIVWRASPAGASPCDFPVREDLLFAKEPPTRDAGWDVKSVTFSPDAKLLAAGIDDGSIRVWSLTDPGQTPGKLTGAGAPVKSIAFDSDGRYLAAGLANGHVLLWDR